MWRLMERARNTAINVAVVLRERRQSESGAAEGKGPTSAAGSVASMLNTTRLQFATCVNAPAKSSVAV